MVDWENIVHFKPEEFDAPNKMDGDFLYLLDTARGNADTPFVIESDWRSKQKNKDVGGSGGPEGVQGKTVFRRGNWTYIPAYEGPAIAAQTNTELGNAAQPQLYDLSQDLGQVRNVAEQHLERVEAMVAGLRAVLESEGTRSNR